jgi:DNA-binding transcriptional ArsR family regulator
MAEADHEDDKSESGKPNKDEAGKKKRKRVRKTGEKKPKPDARQRKISRGRRVADLIWSIAHPVRRRILRVIADRRKPCSPMQISTQLELPLSMVAYHTSVLCKLGAVEPAAEPQARDATERFYDAAVEDAQAIEALLEETREADEEDA